MSDEPQTLNPGQGGSYEMVNGELVLRERTAPAPEPIAQEPTAQPEAAPAPTPAEPANPKRRGWNKPAAAGSAADSTENT